MLGSSLQTVTIEDVFAMEPENKVRMYTYTEEEFQAMYAKSKLLDLYRRVTQKGVEGDRKPMKAYRVSNANKRNYTGSKLDVLEHSFSLDLSLLNDETLYYPFYCLSLKHINRRLTQLYFLCTRLQPYNTRYGYGWLTPQHLFTSYDERVDDLSELDEGECRKVLWWLYWHTRMEKSRREEQYEVRTDGRGYKWRVEVEKWKEYRRKRDEVKRSMFGGGCLGNPNIFP